MRRGLLVDSEIAVLHAAFEAGPSSGALQGLEARVTLLDVRRTKEGRAKGVRGKLGRLHRCTPLPCHAACLGLEPARAAAGTDTPRRGRALQVRRGTELPTEWLPGCAAREEKTCVLQWH